MPKMKSGNSSISSRSSWGARLEKRIIANIWMVQRLLETWRNCFTLEKFWHLAWWWAVTFQMKLSTLKIRCSFGQSARKSLLSWLEACVPHCYLQHPFPRCLQDGVVLCCLLDTLVEGACPRFDVLDPEQKTRNLKLALYLVEKFLHFRPEITVEEILKGDKSIEKNLLILLAQMKTAFEKQNLFQPPYSAKPPDHHLSRAFDSHQNCSAKGMGLMLAVKGRKACFDILILSTEFMDMVIEIRGPKNTACTKRIASARSLSRENCLTYCQATQEIKVPNMSKDIPMVYQILGRKICVGYTPLESGKHNLSIIWQGQHINGSPYVVNVDQSIDILENDYWYSRKPETSRFLMPPGIAYDEKNSSMVIKKRKIIRKKVLRYIVRMGGNDVVIDDPDRLCEIINELKMQMEGEPSGTGAWNNEKNSVESSSEKVLVENKPKEIVRKDECGRESVNDTSRSEVLTNRDRQTCEENVSKKVFTMSPDEENCSRASFVPIVKIELESIPYSNIDTASEVTSQKKDTELEVTSQKNIERSSVNQSKEIKSIADAVSLVSDGILRQNRVRHEVLPSAENQNVGRSETIEDIQVVPSKEKESFHQRAITPIYKISNSYETSRHDRNTERVIVAGENSMKKYSTQNMDEQFLLSHKHSDFQKSEELIKNHDLMPKENCGSSSSCPINLRKENKSSPNAFPANFSKRDRGASFLTIKHDSITKSGLDETNIGHVGLNTTYGNSQLHTTLDEPLRLNFPPRKNEQIATVSGIQNAKSIKDSVDEKDTSFITQKTSEKYFKNKTLQVQENDNTNARLDDSTGSIKTHSPVRRYGHITVVSNKNWSSNPNEKLLSNTEILSSNEQDIDLVYTLTNKNLLVRNENLKNYWMIYDECEASKELTDFDNNAANLPKPVIDNSCNSEAKYARVISNVDFNPLNLKCDQEIEANSITRTKISSSKLPEISASVTSGCKNISDHYSESESFCKGYELVLDMDENICCSASNEHCYKIKDGSASEETNSLIDSCNIKKKAFLDNELDSRCTFPVLRNDDVILKHQNLMIPKTNTKSFKKTAPSTNHFTSLEDERSSETLSEYNENGTFRENISLFECDHSFPFYNINEPKSPRANFSPLTSGEVCNISEDDPVITLLQKTKESLDSLLTTSDNLILLNSRSPRRNSLEGVSNDSTTDCSRSLSPEVEEMTFEVHRNPGDKNHLQWKRNSSSDKRWLPCIREGSTESLDSEGGNTEVSSGGLALDNEMLEQKMIDTKVVCLENEVDEQQCLPLINRRNVECSFENLDDKGRLVRNSNNGDSAEVLRPYRGIPKEELVVLNDKCSENNKVNQKFSVPANKNKDSIIRFSDCPYEFQHCMANVVGEDSETIRPYNGETNQNTVGTQFEYEEEGMGKICVPIPTARNKKLEGPIQNLVDSKSSVIETRNNITDYEGIKGMKENDKISKDERVERYCSVAKSSHRKDSGVRFPTMTAKNFDSSPQHRVYRGIDCSDMAISVSNVQNISEETYQCKESYQGEIECDESYQNKIESGESYQSKIECGKMNQGKYESSKVINGNSKEDSNYSSMASKISIDLFCASPYKSKNNVEKLDSLSNRNFDENRSVARTSTSLRDALPDMSSTEILKNSNGSEIFDFSKLSDNEPLDFKLSELGLTRSPSVKKVIRLFQLEQEEPIDTWPKDEKYLPISPSESQRAFNDNSPLKISKSSDKSEVETSETIDSFKPESIPESGRNKLISIKDRVKLFEKENKIAKTNTGKIKSVTAEMSTSTVEPLSVMDKKRYWENRLH